LAPQPGSPTALRLLYSHSCCGSGCCVRAGVQCRVATPTDIVQEAAPLLATPAFGAALFDTITSWAEGLLVSLVVAIPVGLALGTSDLAYRVSRFTIDFLRTIPPVALIPVALLLYGATPKMAFALIVFGSVWPVLLQAMYGVHQVDPAMWDVATRLRAAAARPARFLILPSAAPFVATGVRLAATISLLLAIGAELIGGAPGIGAAITLHNRMATSEDVGLCGRQRCARGRPESRPDRTGEEVLKWHSAQRSVVAA